ncbi:M20/M25/M40 family metallo-hydrolase [Sporolactobacillus spathodeae]|uniref:Arginine utilization protein RocB n=1 Tax=Sporolactobacillus spathodeae TaxID=1465502 RepID=A0ABS2Q753_9BACL|nr:M20/M25/M40 family metallo-hydrolase [Sporolactobacillus spathodeae]MBM7657623.1 arginine utilization protein RocB [Sporolactobacillus spathodeae]
MYDQIKELPLEEQVEWLTRDLVSVKSVNGTEGEVQIAERLETIIRSFPYFKQHPDQVWTIALNHDALGRKNVFALLKSDVATTKTIIYHGHIDTVGIDDFGPLEHQALDPDALRDYFASYEKDQDVRNDAQSGDWLFGRGALDMKSGDAVHLANLLYYSQHRQLLNGNLLVMFNPVEENDHRGVIDAVDELIRLKSEQHLEFQLALNTDFVSPLYKGDTKRYIYTGAAGKLLGCFFIRGRETHVGETLNGIDPTLIASRINEALNNNMTYAEKIADEVILPASCLYQRDRKAFYNVQTAGAAHLYFNYFLYERAPEEVLSQLKHVAEKACAELADYLKAQYQVFAANCGLLGSAPDWTTPVQTFSEMAAEAKRVGIDIETLTEDAIRGHDNEDFRQRSFRIIEALEAAMGDKRQKVIVFFAPPYCPHNFLRKDVPTEKRCDEILDQVLAEAAPEFGEQFAKKRFFPYLADSSYLSISETADETEAILANFPGWGRIYGIPLDAIRQLNIPCLDIGVYGKRAHTWMERVYKPYSFTKVPTLIRRLTESVLSGSVEREQRH